MRFSSFLTHASSGGSVETLLILVIDGRETLSLPMQYLVGERAGREMSIACLTVNYFVVLSDKKVQGRRSALLSQLILFWLKSYFACFMEVKLVS